MLLSAKEIQLSTTPCSFSTIPLVNFVPNFVPIAPISYFRHFHSFHLSNIIKFIPKYIVVNLGQPMWQELLCVSATIGFIPRSDKLPKLLWYCLKYRYQGNTLHYCRYATENCICNLSPKKDSSYIQEGQGHYSISKKADTFINDTFF